MADGDDPNNTKWGGDYASDEPREDPYKTNWGGQYGSDAPGEGAYATRGNEPSDTYGRPAGQNKGGKKTAPSRGDLYNTEKNGGEPGSGGGKGEGSGDSGEEGKLGRGYVPGKNSKKRRLLTNRKRVAIIGGGGSLVIIFVVLFLSLILPTLKIPQLAANILQYRMVRVSRTFARESSILSSDRVIADTSPEAEVKPYETTVLGKVFGAFKPSIVIDNMKSTGVLQFNYEKGPLNTTRVASVIINGQQIQAPQFKLGRLISNYQERVRFAAQVNGAMGQVLRGNNYLVRSAVSKQLLRAFGIRLQWYEKLGSKYKGLKTDAADRLMLQDTTKRIATPATDGLVPEVDKAASQAQQALDNCVSTDPCAQQIVDTNQLPKEVTDNIDNSVKGLTGNTALSKILGIANPIYGVGMPLCIAYDGSVEASKAFVNSQTLAAIKTFLAVESAADQQKKGDVTSEAVHAFNDRVGNIANSIPENAAAGKTVDTSAEVSPESSKSGEFSVFNVLFSGTAAGIANKIATQTCPVITSTPIAIGTAIANTFVSFFTGGSARIAEGAEATAVDNGIKNILNNIASKLTSKFLTTEGRASIKNTARQYAIGSGKSAGESEALSYLSRMLVLSEMGAFYSGIDSTDFANQADAGGVEYAQTISRQGFYGRPLTNSENVALTQRDNAYLASQKAGQSSYQKLFALSNPNSALATLAVKASAINLSGIETAIVHLPHTLASVFTSFSNIVFGHSLAADTTNANYNIVQWGWSADEEKLIDSDPTYDPLINAQIVENPVNQVNIKQVENNFGKCFTTQIGDLLSGDKPAIVRDSNGNVTDNSGDCSPTNLSYKSTSNYAVDNDPRTKYPNDLIFRWRLDKSYQTTMNELAGIQNPNNSSSGGTSASLVWPFATKDSSQYNRVDQGWDIQSSAGAPVYAIASGRLNVFNADPGGFGNDYPTEELDTSIGGPSNWIYYGHAHIIPSLIGQHVNAGQVIAYTNTQNPQNGSAAPPGWLEIGFARPGTDAPVDTGNENVATPAGQTMHDILINAASGGAP